MENKMSFFEIRLPLLRDSETYKETLADKMDLILDAFGVQDEVYSFENKNEQRILFKPEQRKRKGQLNRLCEKILPDSQVFDTKGLDKYSYETKILDLKKKKDAKLLVEPKKHVNESYKGTDIRIFDNNNNWYPWQKKIYEKIFNESGRFKEPDQRKIISIVDLAGAGGKSSFFKWLFVKNMEEIGRITYGTSSQLKASLVRLGPKQLYIIDLARSKGKNDSERELLSAIEDLKSGLVLNVMYGSADNLIIDPPHIVVSSNYVMDLGILSEDRWEVYELSKNKDLKKLTKKGIFGLKKREMELKKKLENEQDLILNSLKDH